MGLIISPIVIVHDKISAVVKLIPRPPADVVSKNMNFSLLGLLYSSIAEIRSSSAVPAVVSIVSITKRGGGGGIEKSTILSKKIAILQNVENVTNRSRGAGCN